MNEPTPEQVHAASTLGADDAESRVDRSFLDIWADLGEIAGPNAGPGVRASLLEAYRGGASSFW